MSKQRLYYIWKAMRNRCYNPRNSDYKRYGGRGIKVCSRWQRSFNNFYTDMGIPPAGHWLERKDNNGDYSPENCCWATPREQANNTRQVKLVKFADEQISIAEAARRSGLNEACIRWRLNAGWPSSKIFKKADWQRVNQCRG